MVVNSTTELDAIMTTYLGMKECLLHHINCGLVGVHKMMGNILFSSLETTDDALAENLTKDGLTQFDDMENETGVLRHFDSQCNDMKDLILKVLEDGFKPNMPKSSMASVSSYATSDTGDSPYFGGKSGAGSGGGGGGGGYFYNGTNSTFHRDLNSFGEGIPVMFKACVNFLDANALKTEGLFRVAGDNTEVNLLKAGLNAMNHDVDEGVKSLNLDEHTVKNILIVSDKISSNDQIWNIPNIASLLKLWLRELPVSLIPETCYKEIVSLSFGPDTFATKFAANVLPKFGVAHQRNLVALLAFLSKIAHVEENKMVTSERAKRASELFEHPQG